MFENANGNRPLLTDITGFVSPQSHLIVPRTSFPYYYSWVTFIYIFNFHSSKLLFLLVKGKASRFDLYVKISRYIINNYKSRRTQEYSGMQNLGQLHNFLPFCWTSMICLLMTPIIWSLFSFIKGMGDEIFSCDGNTCSISVFLCK